MCSARQVEPGVFEITTPCSWAEVGHRLYSLADPHSIGIAHSDWVLRLLEPLPPWRGQTSGTPNHELAQDRLLERLRSGEVHRSLVDPPAQAAA